MPTASTPSSAWMRSSPSPSSIRPLVRSTLPSAGWALAHPIAALKLAGLALCVSSSRVREPTERTENVCSGGRKLASLRATSCVRAELIGERAVSVYDCCAFRWQHVEEFGLGGEQFLL